jgi:hypothetical protein
VVYSQAGWTWLIGFVAAWLSLAIIAVLAAGARTGSVPLGQRDRVR